MDIYPTAFCLGKYQPPFTSYNNQITGEYQASTRKLRSGKSERVSCFLVVIYCIYIVVIISFI